MDIKYIVLVGIVLAVAVFFFLRWHFRNEKDLKLRKDLDSLGIPKHKALFKHDYVSPGGVVIRSTVPVPDSAMAQIENGISRTIDRHSRHYPHWTKAKKLSDYAVLFVDPMATNVINEPGSPAILVRGVQAAGTCIGVWQFAAAERPYMVIPHQQETSWRYAEYLNNTAAHEGEHLIEFANDFAVFSEWAANDIHPRPFDS